MDACVLHCRTVRPKAVGSVGFVEKEARTAEWWRVGVWREAGRPWYASETSGTRRALLPSPARPSAARPCRVASRERAQGEHDQETRMTEVFVRLFSGFRAAARLFSFWPL